MFGRIVLYYFLPDDDIETKVQPTIIAQYDHINSSTKNDEAIISNNNIIQSYDDSTTTNDILVGNSNNDTELSRVVFHKNDNSTYESVEKENDLETGFQYCIISDLPPNEVEMTKISSLRGDVSSSFDTQPPADHHPDDIAIVVIDSDDVPNQCYRNNTDESHQEIEKISSSRISSSSQEINDDFHEIIVNNNPSNINNNINRTDDEHPRYDNQRHLLHLENQEVNNTDNHDDDEVNKYGREPAKIKCPHCEQYVLTFVEHDFSCITYLSSIILLPIFCPLCWIPCFIPICQTTKHICPNCQNVAYTLKPCQRR